MKNEFIFAVKKGLGEISQIDFPSNFNIFGISSSNNLNTSFDFGGFYFYIFFYIFFLHFFFLHFFFFLIKSGTTGQSLFTKDDSQKLDSNDDEVEVNNRDSSNFEISEETDPQIIEQNILEMNNLEKQDFDQFSIKNNQSATPQQQQFNPQNDPPVISHQQTRPSQENHDTSNKQNYDIFSDLDI